ncbi:acetate--CoA ligase family protein [uncultured Tateyamaria sp.]|uniref:acetate--CoA ligase family protein n=1 Tax=uncultured Tateyamaria sp. TaxID=455651 RepID=UPI00260BDE71|nr:acetate--CoA ligase family protein [uncultured Tateyamaria sp.]
MFGSPSQRPGTPRNPVETGNRDLSRLLRPKSIAVVGGGVWCRSVVEQAERFGFDGAIWPVHPTRPAIAGHGAFPSIADLPYAPDAAFVGVNRTASVDVVADLARIGAGGAVCFASGFSEAGAEDGHAATLQASLVSAAGDMPILGPNCYGFINAVDQALLWPDQHGCTPVARGVAILTQSSNIAINLTMQQRALPIAYAITCGNMAQTGQAELALALLDDPRVTAIGLHIEGFQDLRAWETLAAKAHDHGVPLVALKVGASDQARHAAVSHTASLAGSDIGAQAFLKRLGIARVGALPDFLETLKLLHMHGPVRGPGIASISCSGGEASLVADMALGTGLHFPALTAPQEQALREALGPMVALANPLDYHTYIWGDTNRMARAWAAMTGDAIGMTLAIVDYPTTDATDWACTVQAALTAHDTTKAPFGVVASLPELMPRDTAQTLAQGGVIPFFGLREALAAIDAARTVGPPHPEPVCLPGTGDDNVALTEASAKAQLAAHGLTVPKNCTVERDRVGTAAAAFSAPLALKGVGLTHKTDSGAVCLNVDPDHAQDTAQSIGTDGILIEEMITDGVAELLIGVVRDPAHGFVLTLGAGGTLTELLQDTASMLLPATDQDIVVALGKLRCAPVLAGYRGAASVDRSALIDAILAVQAYVLANADAVSEVEVNPLICTPTRAVAVDALIRKA